MSTDHLFGALRRANRFNRSTFRWYPAFPPAASERRLRRATDALSVPAASRALIDPAEPPSARRRSSFDRCPAGCAASSMICPSDCASAMRSASSGVTISVTTFDGAAALVSSDRLSADPVGCPARHHLHVPGDGPRHAVFALADRDHQVDAAARLDESGDADHVVHLDRDGAHAPRNRGRQAARRRRGGAAWRAPAARSRARTSAARDSRRRQPCRRRPPTGLAAGHATTLTSCSVS